MQLFDGREHAKILDKKILDHISSTQFSKKLLIVQVGENLSSEKYINIKKRVGEKLGIFVELLKFSSDFDILELKNLLIKEFGKEDVGGIIIQLPLPGSKFEDLLSLIPEEKDVDLINPNNLANYYTGNLGRKSPVVRAVEYFLGSNNINIQNKKVLMIGGSRLVGGPVSFFLKNLRADVEITENYSPGDPIIADLIVSSTGISNLVSGGEILEGCNFIDFGSGVKDRKIVGDLDMNSGIDHLGVISPSPGGMGPLVVRFLFMNLVGL